MPKPARRCSRLLAVPPGPLRLLVWALVFVSMAACDDLDDFRTGEGEAFVGTVVGNSVTDAGDGSGRAFVLLGFEAGTVMQLSFDPGAVGPGESPGSLSTYTCDDGLKEACPESLRTPGPISAAPLRPIDGLQHDALSRYDFPGASRLRNYMFHVPVGPADGAGGFAMVFLSLMESGRIEVRVVFPGNGAGALFGVFRLNRGAQ